MKSSTFGLGLSPSRSCNYTALLVITSVYLNSLLQLFSVLKTFIWQQISQCSHVFKQFHLIRHRFKLQEGTKQPSQTESSKWCSESLKLVLNFSTASVASNFFKNLHKHTNNRTTDYNTPFHNGIIFTTSTTIHFVFPFWLNKVHWNKTVWLCWLTKPTICFPRIETFLFL